MKVTLAEVPHNVTLLLCPECTQYCDYIHFLEEPTFDWEAGEVTVPMYCEYGHHRFNVVFKFHKGNMMVSADKWVPPPITYGDLKAGEV